MNTSILADSDMYKCRLHLDLNNLHKKLWRFGLCLALVFKSIVAAPGRIRYLVGFLGFLAVNVLMATLRRYPCADFGSLVVLVLLILLLK